MNDNPKTLSTEEILAQLKEFSRSQKETPALATIHDDIENKKSITVAIIGLPNAGKSSLMNAIVGEKIAGVSSKVQTTRNAIRGIKLFGSTQIIFVDSPGVIKPKSVIDNFLFEATKRTLRECELLMVLMDIRSKNDENFNYTSNNY